LQPFGANQFAQALFEEWEFRLNPAKRLAISGENDIESVRQLTGV
jgi:hypothetical protein